MQTDWNRIEEDPDKIDYTKPPFDGKSFLGCLSNGWQLVGHSPQWAVNAGLNGEIYPFSCWILGRETVPMVHTHFYMPRSDSQKPNIGLRLIAWKLLTLGPDWLAPHLREPI